jgi:hypothetical protein
MIMVGVLQSNCPVSDHFRTDARAIKMKRNNAEETDVH